MFCRFHPLLVKEIQGELLSFGNLEASSSFPNKGTHHLSLFTVINSSFLESVSPTLTNKFSYLILYRVTIIREPNKYSPHLIIIRIKYSLHYPSCSLHNSYIISLILILFAFIFFVTDIIILTSSPRYRFQLKKSSLLHNPYHFSWDLRSITFQNFDQNMKCSRKH